MQCIIRDKWTNMLLSFRLYLSILQILEKSKVNIGTHNIFLLFIKMHIILGSLKFCVVPSHTSDSFIRCSGHCVLTCVLLVCNKKNTHVLINQPAYARKQFCIGSRRNRNLWFSSFNRKTNADNFEEPTSWCLKSSTPTFALVNISLASLSFSYPF